MLFSFIRHVYLNICFNFNRYNKKKTYWVSIILEIFKWKLSRESQPGVGGAVVWVLRTLAVVTARDT